MKFTIPIILSTLLLVSADAKCRRRTFKLTDKFCANVPTESTRLDSHAFAGVWFQIFLTTGTHAGTQINKCTADNYILQRDNSFKDLKCEFDDLLKRPRYLPFTLIQRKDGGPGSFLAEGPAGATFPLNIVAVLGSKSYGYFAAALFQCDIGRPRAPGYFILARKPVFQKTVLKRLKKKLRCLGFPVPKRKDFQLTKHKGCKYFFNKTGFDVITPEELMEAATKNA